MNKIIILQGLPASGKSTWARQYVQDHWPGWIRVNKDDIRKMLHTGKWSKESEKEVLRIRDFIITDALLSLPSKSVIVDDTNFEQKHIDAIIEIAKIMDGTEIEVKTFNVDPKECIKRNALRPESERVPEKVIWDMYKRYVAPNEYKNTPKLKQDPDLPRAIICDLDGTLALIKDRSPYDCEKCEQDDLNEAVKLVLKSIYMSIYCKIIFVSGRNEHCREATERWLNSKVPSLANCSLFMREDNDNRKDAVVKKEIFDKHIRNKYYVSLVLDDRSSVVDLWRREIGLPCFQVNYGDF